MDESVVALSIALMGAEESIYIRGSAELLRQTGLADGHLLAVDSRLDLRCLLCQPAFVADDDPFVDLDIYDLQEPFPDDAQASSYDWQLRRLDRPIAAIEVLIDQAQWFSIVPDGQMVDRGDPAQAVEAFLSEWEQADVIEQIFEDVSDDLLEEPDDPLLVDPSSYWDRVLRYLSSNPEQLRSMDDRKFEELVAELLDRDGFEVKLTPQSRDGGYDVLAMKKIDWIELLFLVECKRFHRERRVGVQIVRQLYGVVQRKRATAGLIVTTSSFTKPAVRESEETPRQMALRDYEALVNWIGASRK